MRSLPAEPALIPFGQRRLPRRRLLIGLAAAAVVAALAYGADRQITPGTPVPASSYVATSLATISQRSLSAQVQANGTIGYGASTNVVAPSGSNQQGVDQASQQVNSTSNALAADRTAAADAAASSQQTISADQVAVNNAQSQLSTDQATENSDCAVDPSGAVCANDKAAVAHDQAALTQAQNMLAAAQLQARQQNNQNNARVTADQAALQNAQSSLANAQQRALNPGLTFTELPTVGEAVSRGQQLYALDGIPVPLFYGSVTPWRDFRPGMSDGPDVGELNQNLIALGFGSGLTQSTHFSTATRAAIGRWQASIGAPQTDVIELGDIVFEPGAIIVTSVTPSVGSAVLPGGPIMQVASSTPRVTVNLDAALQAQVQAGAQVSVTLPNNQTTNGVVTSIGTVATAPSSNGAGGSNNSTPTIPVYIELTDPAAAGHLDQAPVHVAITTQTIQNALVVPVTALLAQPGGGYALEIVDSPSQHHHLVPVTIGLFDDADGLVQVSGAGVTAGERVVVPLS